MQNTVIARDVLLGDVVTLPGGFDSHTVTSVEYGAHSARVTLDLWMTLVVRDEIWTLVSREAVAA